MILSIGEVLSSAVLQELRGLIARGRFEDGRETAGWSARLVKNNRQLAENSETYDAIMSLLLGALHASQTLQIAALPRSFRQPLISESGPGMGYGPHIDDALMGHPMTRADLSYTLFLSAPDEYSGGELVLEDTEGERAYKLPSGSLVLYPSTYLHRVGTVGKGTRLVAVGWIQSVCRSAAHREIQFDLHRLLTAEFERSGKSASFDLLTKTRSNLLRLFAEV